MGKEKGWRGRCSKKGGEKKYTWKALGHYIHPFRLPVQPHLCGDHLQAGSSLPFLCPHSPFQGSCFLNPSTPLPNHASLPASSHKMQVPTGALVSPPRMQTWRRKWQPTPVFLLGKSHGQRRPAGYSPQGCKESDMT